MKTFMDYINEHNGKVTQSIIVSGMNSNDFIFEMGGDERIYVYTDTGFPLTVAEGEYDLMDYFENEWRAEIRFCGYCGCIMQSGYTDDNADFYNCEECFENDMNDRYGEGNWRSTPDGEENWMGGYYEYKNENGEWEAEPSYYTEWY